MNTLNLAVELTGVDPDWLQLEEYDAEEIERYRPHIDDCIGKVCSTLAYEERVLTAYRAMGLPCERTNLK